LLTAALAVGSLVGFISGLTGIGGGVLMVPFLYAAYDALGLPPARATPLAHATSLMVIVPAAVRSLIGYRGTGLVRWRAALPMALVAASCAALVAPLTPLLPSTALRIGFGLFLVSVAADLLVRRTDHADSPPPGRAHSFGAALIGVPVGSLSAALGVGGGIPATIGMHYVLKLPFRVMVPTSLAVVALTAGAGTLSYLLTPAGALPFGPVVGFVDFKHGLPLGIGAVLFAPVGVWVNRRAPVRRLRLVFGALLLLIGVELLWSNIS
jgi:uncharacterized membrane protein YfcA